MSIEALKAVLEQLPDPSFVEGKTKLVERFAIALPDGDVGALDDKTFVAWLDEHAEDAPFGHGGETTGFDRQSAHQGAIGHRGAEQVGPPFGHPAAEDLPPPPGHSAGNAARA